jgi:hypothetical protein
MLNLFDQAVRAGEAQRVGALIGQRPLIPALKGCRQCGTLAMIASPALGRCADCGQELEVMSSPQSPSPHSPA